MTSRKKKDSNFYLPYESPQFLFVTVLVHNVHVQLDIAFIIERMFSEVIMLHKRVHI